MIEMHLFAFLPLNLKLIVGFAYISINFVGAEFCIMIVIFVFFLVQLSK